MREDYLVHFNPNHDPKNGKFAKSKVTSTAVRAAAIGTAVGTGFAAERALDIKRNYKDATVGALIKSSAYSFGRAAVAASLAVIGDQLVRDHTNKKAVKNQNG